MPVRLCCLASACLSVLPAQASAAPAAEEQPNIVLIYADDLGYGDLSCYGATQLRTPRIDRLASEGRRFTDAHSASAVCSPSRYGLMTGEYPLRKNLWGPIGRELPLVVELEQRTLASHLREAGYATACIGKWHLGFGTERPDWNDALRPGPLELGFDTYFGLPVVNSSPPYVYVLDHHVVGWEADDPFVRGQRSAAQEFPEKNGLNALGGARRAHELYRDEQVAGEFAARAIAWMEEREVEDARPFFLYLATTNIHHPFTPAERFQGTSECGLYGDFVHELDWLVGEVLDALERLGEAENTLLVLTSDNGGMLNLGGQEAWRQGHRLNGELLGFKFGAWEGGHRVPMIVRWPGRVPAGTESDDLFSQVDFLATFAQASGLALPDDHGTDSVAQLRAWTAEAQGELREHLVVSPNSPQHLMLRHGDWAYIPAPCEGGFRQKNVGDHTFGGGAVFAFTGQTNDDFAEGRLREGAPAAQLYDLSADPGQAHNALAEHPEVVAELAALLESYRALIPDTRPIGWIAR